MSLFKRIGTKGVKYNFELEFQKLDINLNFKCDFQIVWKRGSKHTLQTLRKVPYDINKGCAYFSESLFLDATLFYSKKNGKYQEKESQIFVKFKNELGEKTAGKCTFELSQFVNANITEKKMVIPLQSPDPKAKIQVNLIVTKLGEVDGNESQISDDSFREEKVHQFGQNNNQGLNYKETVSDDTVPIRETISEDRPSIPNNAYDLKKKQLQQQQQQQQQLNQNQQQINQNDDVLDDDDDDLLDLEDEDEEKEDYKNRLIKKRIWKFIQ
ncbi:hypothetical protein PPERSA_09315 [Pseudocohnilembus persalinus]|uniref:C2 NT-type domain-containing protein n=1 Tax=Pseudocohnilembus persalinus TaxID=266149 RepID=A0A0V0R572_PSEPJ|nr:hypothetical protein PPERSA_09315 [Pseudocohnilembus persalinus]|eukprot:KRX09645.1 hypothetical protein PPERSA_09315 [Pseudocohnilembus persalinus]